MSKSKKKPSTGLRYIGRGAHLDVPRRDLTPSEVEKFGLRWLLSLRCPNAGGAMYAKIESESIIPAGEVANVTERDEIVHGEN